MRRIGVTDVMVLDLIVLRNRHGSLAYQQQPGIVLGVQSHARSSATSSALQVFIGSGMQLALWYMYDDDIVELWARYNEKDA